LEKLYRDLLNGKRNALSELLDFFDEQWEKHWDDHTIKMVRQELSPEQHRCVGRECIEKYYARFTPFQGDITLGVERRLNFVLDHEGRYRMQGLIDRLARSKDGVWEIHDYKTSGYLPTQ
jgi:RecB family exonuclease